MTISVSARFAFVFEEVGDALLQFEAAALPEQRIINSKTSLSEAEHVARVAAHNSVGERIWVHGSGRFEVRYSAEIEVDRKLPDLAELAALPTHLIPGEVTEYLFGSRFCTVEQFENFVDTEFVGTSGGARIESIRDWIAEHFTYDPAASGPNTNAAESFIERRGVCRDYAHVMVAMARASLIPARYVACFAPGVTPQDFHAVAEVFLADPEVSNGGAWYLVDPTGMANPAQTAKIGVGRDAADVSFLTTFGPASFACSEISVTLND